MPRSDSNPALIPLPVANPVFEPSCGQVGFNAGHSAIVWLQAATTQRLFSFDLCTEAYCEAAQQLVEALFPGRLRYVKGNSIKTFGAEAKPVAPHQCDLVFIDGYHNGFAPLRDLSNGRDASHNGSIVVADDCSPRFPDVERAFRTMATRNQVQVIPDSTRPSSRVSQHSPSQADMPSNGTALTASRVVGSKGWCVGWYVK